jgi:hypothetical protein
MRDLFIEPSGNHELHDLALTGCEQFETLSKFPEFRALEPCAAIVVQCLPDCVHQLVFFYRLR